MTTESERRAESERITSAIEDFLARGKKITQVPEGESAAYEEQKRKLEHWSGNHKESASKGAQQSKKARAKTNKKGVLSD